MLANKKDLKVAVYMITYNQEGYIAKAIESILMQKTNFIFKLFIGEDYSPDNTRKICKEYVKKYPDKIHLKNQKENIGASENARSIYTACFKSGADYVAMLEGDDYWTDPLKLQKQVDFLDANKDFSCCAHLSKIEYEDTPESGNQLYDKAVNNSGVLNKYDFLSIGKFHTSSLLYRRVLLKNLIHGKKELFRDNPLKINLLHHGNIKILPEIMSIYRRNMGGISENINVQEIYRAEIVSAHALGEELEGFYFKSQFLKSHWHRFYLSNGFDLNFSERVSLFLKFLIPSFYIFPRNLKQIASALHKVFFHKNITIKK